MAIIILKIFPLRYIRAEPSRDYIRNSFTIRCGRFRRDDVISIRKGEKFLPPNKKTGPPMMMVGNYFVIFWKLFSYFFEIFSTPNCLIDVCIINPFWTISIDVNRLKIPSISPNKEIGIYLCVLCVCYSVIQLREIERKKNELQRSY
jgi:hypothetical protein